MATITVYAFKIYNPEHDLHVRAKGMATEKTIEQIENSTIIRSESKQIDDSELTQSKRYYDPVKKEQEESHLKS